ncbi:MAG TPA: carboxypeptidase-like regulatory domain-containing protein, partial [Bacteroidota bacterium]|nr:carboxypeptidase-like regulatory domain-containing protein [Bacteroidota bacterium]
MQRRLFAVLFAAVLLPALLLAQDGKLRGRITDRDSGEPLVGANVFVEGTNLGAACDINGDYVILSVRPGVYTLRVSYVGYNQLTVSNVRVNANITTTQDFKLSSSAIQVQAVEIIAERPLIQRNTTNTVRITTQEEINQLPVRGVANILSLQAGVVLQA